VKCKVTLKNQAWKSGSLSSVTWIFVLCFGVGVSKLLVQGGGVGLVKPRGAGHKEYNLLAEVAVMDAGYQLSNKTPALLQFAVSVCTVLEACCDCSFQKQQIVSVVLEIMYYGTIIVLAADQHILTKGWDK
jgi:hypothetical protein